MRRTDVGPCRGVRPDEGIGPYGEGREQDALDERLPHTAGFGAGLVTERNAACGDPHLRRGFGNGAFPTLCDLVPQGPGAGRVSGPYEIPEGTACVQGPRSSSGSGRVWNPPLRYEATRTVLAALVRSGFQQPKARKKRTPTSQPTVSHRRNGGQGTDQCG